MYEGIGIESININEGRVRIESGPFKAYLRIIKDDSKGKNMSPKDIMKLWNLMWKMMDDEMKEVERQLEENMEEYEKRKYMKTLNDELDKNVINNCFCGEDKNMNIVKLPNCNHYFHKNCIYKWFSEHSSDMICPLCREGYLEEFKLKKNYYTSPYIDDDGEYDYDSESEELDDDSIDGCQCFRCVTGIRMDSSDSSE